MPGIWGLEATGYAEADNLEALSNSIGLARQRFQAPRRKKYTKSVACPGNQFLTAFLNSRMAGS